MNNTNDSPAVPIEEPKWSETDKRERNRYLREFLPAMAAYAIILTIVISLVDEDTAGARFWILLPVLPMVAAALAVYRSVQRADEYSRLIQLESLALGFGVMIIASLVFGFLGVVGVALTYSGWLIFSAGMVTWGVTLGLRANI